MEYSVFDFRLKILCVYVIAIADVISLKSQDSGWGIIGVRLRGRIFSGERESRHMVVSQE